MLLLHVSIPNKQQVKLHYTESAPVIAMNSNHEQWTSKKHWPLQCVARITNTSPYFLPTQFEDSKWDSMPYRHLPGRVRVTPPLLSWEVSYRYACTKFGKLILRKIVNCCHEMSYFKAKMHEIWFRLGLRPRPWPGSLQSSSRPPIWT